MKDHGGTRIENGTVEETRSEGCALWKMLLTVVEVTNHAMIFLVTGYVLYLCGAKLNTTNVHVGLCTVGYVLLMSEAITILIGDSLLSRRLSRRVIGHIHWVLQLLGVAFNIAGVVLIYLPKKRHFTSIHGILGFASVVIMCVVSFSGIPVIFATSLRKRIRPVTSKLCHNFLGIACFVLGMLSQCYGYQKRWMTGYGQDIADVCTVFTGLITIFSLIGAARSLRGQVVCRGAICWLKNARNLESMTINGSGKALKTVIK